MPGYCEGDLAPIAGADRRAGRARPARPAAARRVLRPAARAAEDYGGYDIEILAEINHAPRLTLAEILAQAARAGAPTAPT